MSRDERDRGDVRDRIGVRGRIQRRQMDRDEEMYVV